MDKGMKTDRFRMELHHDDVDGDIGCVQWSEWMPSDKEQATRILDGIEEITELKPSGFYVEIIAVRRLT